MDQHVELIIERLAYEGGGIAHLDNGKTVFVEGSCPGDRVLVRIFNEKEHFAHGEIVSIVNPSPDRVIPPCPYYALCGGCPWQHINYTAQLEWKRRAVYDALTRIGRLGNAEELVSPTIPSKHQWGYRNKVEFEMGHSENRLILGLHGRGSSEVIPIETCLLLPKRFQSIPKALGGAVRYAMGDSDLGIERVGARISSRTKDVEIALWTKPGSFPRSSFARVIGSAVKSTSIVRVLLKGSQKERKIGGVEVLSGNGFWRERIGEETMKLSAPSFFQVNTEGAEKLVALVLEGLAIDELDHALDLYAGAGTFTLPLARRASEVDAVESAGSSVRDLRRNLEESGLFGEVIGGDVARELPTLESADIAVVDPPRTGLSKEALAALVACGARRITYVSCNPTTLARDLARFSEQGYRTVAVTPVDLFPQTYHVECVAVLESTANIT